MTKKELLNKLQDIEWEDFEVKSAKGGLPKSVWESVSLHLHLHSDIPIRFSSDLDTSTTVFYLPKQVSDQVSDQALIEYCKTPRSINELMKFAGMKHKTYFRNKIIKPLLEKGILELTVPDKPNSPNQKYIKGTK